MWSERSTVTDKSSVITCAASCLPLLHFIGGRHLHSPVACVHTKGFGCRSLLHLARWVPMALFNPIFNKLTAVVDEVCAILEEEHIFTTVFVNFGGIQLAGGKIDVGLVHIHVLGADPRVQRALLLVCVYVITTSAASMFPPSAISAAQRTTLEVALLPLKVCLLCTCFTLSRPNKSTP
jgi:hypothetical protein